MFIHFLITQWFILINFLQNNSAGLLCERCKNGYFYLTSSNPEGCTNCVCMGINTNCSSTRHYRKKVKERHWLWLSMMLENHLVNHCVLWCWLVTKCLKPELWMVCNIIQLPIFFIMGSCHQCKWWESITD